MNLNFFKRYFAYLFYSYKEYSFPPLDAGKNEQYCRLNEDQGASYIIIQLSNFFLEPIGINVID